MLGNIGTTGFLLIIVVALILFGPSKLPELGRAFGKTLREFKAGAKEMIAEEEEPAGARKEVNEAHIKERKAESSSRLPD
jgi:sec-independent protein translocase protein TatA